MTYWDVSAPATGDRSIDVPYHSCVRLAAGVYKGRWPSIDLSEVHRGCQLCHRQANFLPVACSLVASHAAKAESKSAALPLGYSPPKRLKPRLLPDHSGGEVTAGANHLGGN